MEDNTENKQKRKRFVGSRKKIIIIAGLVGVVIVLAIYAVLFFMASKESNRVIFVIDGKEYRKDEVESFTKYRVEKEGDSLDQAGTTLYEALKTIEAAKKVKLDINDEQVQAQKSQLYQEGGISDQDKRQYDKWFTVLAQQSVIYEMLAGGDTEGYIFDFYFGQHIQYGSSYKPEGQGNEKLISQDRQYAKERAEYYHAQLSTGAISPDAVLQEILADPKLGNDNNSTSNHSMHFKTTEEDVWQNQIYSSDAIGFIQKQTTINIPSEIQTVKGGVAPDINDEADIKYYFVYMKSLANVPVTGEEFSQALSSLHAEYKGYE